MHFGKNNPKNYFVLYDRVLDTITHGKDLGVIVGDQLKFHEHAAVAAKKANQILGLIKKSYSSRDPYTITRLRILQCNVGSVYLGDVRRGLVV